jgi:hypothetical protein
MGIRTRIIIDFDGTLTAEERQATRLGGRSLDTLADILAPATGQERDHLRQSLETAYRAARREILAHSELGGWEVSGLLASYGDEGAFILNTSAIQLLLASLLRRHPAAVDALEAALPAREYGLVEDTSNYLFHRHTAEFPPLFRPEAREVLVALLEREDCEPVVLTNSLGDKVERLLATLDLPRPLRILGDTRQYEMVEDWEPPVDANAYSGPGPAPWQPPWLWSADEGHLIDLRRPAYYRALVEAGRDGACLAVVADTLSLPGALPMAMGIPFYLLHTPYTPDWVLRAVGRHPCGHVLDRLRDLPAAVGCA